MKRRFSIPFALVLCLTCFLSGCNAIRGAADNTEKTDLKTPAASTPSPTTEQTSAKDNPSDKASEEQGIRIAIDERDIWSSVWNTKETMDSLDLDMEVLPKENTQKVFEAFLKGEVNALGCSIATLAQMEMELASVGKEAAMVCVVMKSKGADVVLSQSDISTVTELLDSGEKVAVYAGSDAYDMLLWNINNDSRVDPASKENTKNIFEWYRTAAEAETAFVEGKTAALCTNSILPEYNILLSSEYNDTVIVYGIVFDKKFLEANKMMITHFVAAILKSAQSTNPDKIASIDLAENYSLFGLRNESNKWVKRRSLLGDLYVDMGGMSLNTINPDILLRLVNEPAPSSETNKEDITILPTNKGIEIYVPEKSYDFYFEGNSDVFSIDPTDSLQSVYNDLTARGGMNLVIFGHVANTGVGDTADGRQTSLDRAMAVAYRLIDDYGVDAKRISVVGMGILLSDSKLNQLDRRVDVLFMHP